MKHIIDNEDWCYTLCLCNKSVYLDEKQWFCDKCNRHVKKVVPDYLDVSKLIKLMNGLICCLTLLDATFFDFDKILIKFWICPKVSC